MDLAAAETYVRRQGSALDQARLDYMFYGQNPIKEAIENLLEGQGQDGGWPAFWSGEASSLDATCFRLARAVQMGLQAGNPALSRALAFIQARQAQDGSWEEDARLAELAPPWATPGDQAALLYLTSNCAFWLSTFGYDLPAGQAAEYLESFQGQDGSLPSYLQTHWLAGSLWHRLEVDERAARVFGSLLPRLADLSASDLAWLVASLRTAGVHVAHPLVEQSAAILAGTQDEDGSWSGENGAPDIQITLEALWALHLCERF